MNPPRRPIQRVVTRIPSISALSCLALGAAPSPSASVDGFAEAAVRLDNSVAQLGALAAEHTALAQQYDRVVTEMQGLKEQFVQAGAAAQARPNTAAQSRYAKLIGDERRLRESLKRLHDQKPKKKRRATSRRQRRQR